MIEEGPTHGHDHEYDPERKPPYITLFLLLAMIALGLFLVFYFEVL